MEEKDFERIVKKSKEKFIDHEEKINLAHRWDHVERVINNCKKILQLEESHIKSNRADGDIVILSAILHDAGRYRENEKDEKGKEKGHEYWSAKIAEDILKTSIKECNLDIDFESVKKIIDIIRYHSEYDETKMDEKIKSIYNLIEFKILTDADKIDSFGPIGIIRASLDEDYQGSAEKQLNHIKAKCDPKKYLLRTYGGNELGKEYKKYLCDFTKIYEEQKNIGI